MTFPYWIRRTMGLSHKWHRATRLDIGIGSISTLYRTACGMVLGIDEAMVSQDLSGAFLTCDKCERKVILEAATKILKSDNSQTELAASEMTTIQRQQESGT